MVFFPGSRGGDKKKVSASERYKQQMSGNKQKELTPDQKYKKMLEDKMQKMMEDAIMGRKKAAARLPGTKAPDESEPPPISKNAKLMLQMLAIQKMKREQKKDKKRLREEIWAEKAKKNAEALKKNQQLQMENAKNQQAAADAAAAEATSSSYTGYGSTYGDDNKGW